MNTQARCKHVLFTDIPSDGHKPKRQRHTRAARAHRHVQTQMHIHTHAHPPRRSTRPRMIPGPHLPLQLNWVPLSPALPSVLLPSQEHPKFSPVLMLLHSLFSQLFPGLTLSHPSVLRFNIASSVGPSPTTASLDASLSYSIMHLVWVLIALTAILKSFIFVWLFIVSFSH